MGAGARTHAVHAAKVYEEGNYLLAIGSSKFSIWIFISFLTVVLFALSLFVYNIALS